MKLELTQGQHTTIDDDDSERVNKFKWYAAKRKGGYVAETSFRKDGKKVNVTLHRFITNCPKGMDVDHLNHDTLDNRKENLRVCSHHENTLNRRKYSNSSATSEFKGVRVDTNTGKFIAAISVEGKEKYLGIFEEEIDAAREYDKAAMFYHKEFAVLNFDYDYDYTKIDDYSPKKSGINTESKVSEYSEIMWDDNKKMWKVVVEIRGVSVTLGLEYTEDAAIELLNKKREELCL